MHTSDRRSTILQTPTAAPAEQFCKEAVVLSVSPPGTLYSYIATAAAAAAVNFRLKHLTFK